MTADHAYGYPVAPTAVLGKPIQMNPAVDYRDFLARKSQLGGHHGFEPLWMPDFLFDFQKALVEWAIRQGRAAIFADCGLGKGLRPECPVLTPTGWKPIGSLSVGDLVIGRDGLPYATLAIHHRGEQPIYRVDFSDGTFIECDGDHLWNVRSMNDVARGKPWRTMSTTELSFSKIRYGEGDKSRTWHIPLVESVQFFSRQRVIDPYLLGVLLGDGALSGNDVSWCKNDEEIAHRVRPTLPDGVSVVRHQSADRADSWQVHVGRGNSNPITNELRRLGLMGLKSESKFVPDEYLFSSPDERIALLQGLMDTDGYCGETPEFSSASKALAEAVVFLAQSLGGTARTALKESPTYTYKGEKRVGQPSWRVTMTLPLGVNPFWLDRKSCEYRTPSRGLGRWIDAITSIGTGETVCIRVDSPDSLFVTKDFIVTHNTPMQLVWADNVVRKTGGKVLIVAPLAVSAQTKREAEKFGMEVHVSRDGSVGPQITVSNYERLHYFNAADFIGAVADESSAIKAFNGKRRKQVTRFFSKLPYRLLCTATPSPNDFIELGTNSECLGVMTQSDMLGYFFKENENRRHTVFTDEKHQLAWVFKPHSEQPFWRWVSSWARALQKPSDLGFDDTRFVLPPLNTHYQIVDIPYIPRGELFPRPAISLREQREERVRTVRERCDLVASLVNHDRPAIVWCHLNCEGDYLEKAIPDCVQIAGCHDIEEKEAKLIDFAMGNTRVMVTKPKIGCWGLNLQHCGDMTFFPTHSYEGFYQGIRRCWRFGRNGPVNVEIVSSQGESRVIAGLEQKQQQAAHMFSSLVQHMNDALAMRSKDGHDKPTITPSWLKAGITREPSLCQ